MSHKISLVSYGSTTSAQAPDVNFLRSWVLRSSTVAARSREKFNWNFFVGLVVAGGLSAGFWVAVGVALTNLR